MPVPGTVGRALRSGALTAPSRIAAIDVVRNPDKLTGVREPG